jgi:hypothetical protein
VTGPQWSGVLRKSSICSALVTFGWHENFDHDRAARFLKDVRQCDLSAEDVEFEEKIIAWAIDHEVSLDWLILGDPRSMICCPRGHGANTGGAVMSALKCLDRVPAGWFVLNVMRTKGLKWDWVALISDVDIDDLKNCVVISLARLLFVHPDDYRAGNSCVAAGLASHPGQTPELRPRLGRT